MAQEPDGDLAIMVKAEGDAGSTPARDHSLFNENFMSDSNTYPRKIKLFYSNGEFLVFSRSYKNPQGTHYYSLDSPGAWGVEVEMIMGTPYVISVPDSPKSASQPIMSMELEAIY
jgi:hypothetical protein